MARQDRGFASLDLNRRREISSKGGQAAHRQGKAHQWTTEEAREAGRKGGMASHRRGAPQTTHGFIGVDVAFSPRPSAPSSEQELKAES